MINKLLPILSLALLCFILHEQSLKPFSFHKRPKSQLRGAPAVYQALITGNKSGVPRKTIDTMKTFGLMHLLTPSGLHLGSFLLLFKCFPKFKFLITLLMFLGSFSIPGFLALKRMLVFYLVNFRLKNIQLSFIATFILSLLIGNYAESPMSFA
ncbi:MAG: ComEC/Rec2 family competence protein, partial [Bacteriovoracaceae bacterium]